MYRDGLGVYAKINPGGFVVDNQYSGPQKVQFGRLAGCEYSITPRKEPGAKLIIMLLEEGSSRFEIKIISTDKQFSSDSLVGVLSSLHLKHN